MPRICHFFNKWRLLHIKYSTFCQIKFSTAENLDKFPYFTMLIANSDFKSLLPQRRKFLIAEHDPSPFFSEILYLSHFRELHIPCIWYFGQRLAFGLLQKVIYMKGVPGVFSRSEYNSIEIKCIVKSKLGLDKSWSN